MNMKKLSAVLIALVLAFSLSTVAFATPAPVTDSTTGTINITAQNVNDTFALYKIVETTYNSTTNTLSYAFNDSVKAFFNSKNLTVAQYMALTSDSDAINALLGELSAWISANSVNAAFTRTAAGSPATCTVTDVPMGQYLVLCTGNASGGAPVYQLTTANVEPTVVDHSYVLNDLDLVIKSLPAPTITKIAADDNQSTSNGQSVFASAYDTVNYTVTVTVPAYPAYAANRTFTVTDNLPEGLSYVSGSLNITAGTGNAAFLTNGNLTRDASTGVYTYTFNYADIAAYKGQSITLTYKAILDDKSVNNVGTDSLTNTAKLTYSSNSYGTTTSEVNASSTVHTNQFTITKVDSATTSTVLPNAEFDVYAAFTAAQVSNLKAESGATEATGAALTALGTAPAGTNFYKIGHLSTGADGKATMHQVEDGTYYLVETKAPSGYSLPTTAFTVGVGTTGAGGSTITNTSNIFLPSTGGAGTVLFTVGGIAILVSAGAFLFLNRKRVFGE